MVDAFIRAGLGDIGGQILDFYLANSLPINTVVFLYGMVMVMSWTNTFNIRKRLLYDMLVQMTSRDDIGKKSKVNRVLSEINIPWQDAIDATRFPFVAKRGGLWPRKKSLEVVQELINEEELAGDAIEMLGGKNRTMHRKPKRRR